MPEETSNKPMRNLGFHFCPRCHKRIDPPKWLKKANIVAEKGINLQCGYCKKGQVTIFLPKREEIVQPQLEQSV